MIGCLRTRVRKQPIIALYFESELVLKFYNLKALSNAFVKSNKTMPVLVHVINHIYCDNMSLHFYKLLVKEKLA